MWVEKDKLRTKHQINKLRGHQRYSHVKRAYMTIADDPQFANINASIIHPTANDENGAANLQTTIPETGDFDECSFSMNTPMVEEFKRQQREATQLQADLASAKARIASLIEQMNQNSLDHANQMKSLIQETLCLNEAAAKA